MRPIESYPREQWRRRVMPFMFLTVFLDLIGFGFVFPLLPFYVKSMGGTAQTVGIMLGCFSLTQFFATPILGRLSDRVGRRPVILLSLLGNAISMVVFALATRITLLPLLFFSRIVAGATAGNLAACQASIADISTKEDRASNMGQLGASIGMGIVLGPVMGGLLSKIGPSIPPLGAAVMALIDLVAAYLFMPETHAARPKTDPVVPVVKTTLWDVLSQRRLAIVFSIYFLTFACMTNLQVALALFVNVRFHWDAREVGYLFGLYGLLGSVIQGLLIRPTMRAFKAETLLLMASLLTAVGLALIGHARVPIELIVGLSIMSIGMGYAIPVTSSLTSESAGPERQGAVLGIAQSVGSLARSIGPVLSGFLFAHVSAGSPFYSGALFAAACAGLSILLVQTKSKD